MATAWRWLVFASCVLLLVSGLFGKTSGEAERYGYLTDIMPGDWAPTNVWLESSDCALAHGAWLAALALLGARPHPVSLLDGDVAALELHRHGEPGSRAAAGAAGAG